MQYLANAFRAAPVVQPTGAEMVDRYCDRATHSTLIEDRRAAVLGLKGLAQEYKLDVGIKGMPILIDILNNDLRDTEITKAVLEALTILCTSEEKTEKAGEESKEKDTDDLSIQFTEILIKDPKNVTTLLQALEGNDFYVRFFTIRLLDSLMQNKPAQLQNCILTSPMGVSRLIDLLDDKREIIRNEGLLLLISLSKSNAEIQKIIAFENTFEKLLGIILQEGSTDGGIIVQDCLQLTHNLLRYNVSNQNLFRESSCIKVLPRLLVSKVPGPKNTLKEVPLTEADTEWEDQKIINTTLILGVIRILVVPNNPNTTLNQNFMQQCKIVDTLIDIAFSQKIPNKIRSQALYAIADIIKGNNVNQDSFVKHVIQRTDRPNISPISSPRRSRTHSRDTSTNTFTPPQPILLAIVQIVLNPSKNDDFTIRAAATYTFQSYVNNNPDGQLALLSTIMPPPDENPNDDVVEKPQSPGTMILSSLLEWNTTRKDPYKTWFASVLLSHILMKNELCKLMALRLNLFEYDEQISLLHKCMYSYITATKENVDVRVLIGFLCLLAVWLYNCPKAVNEFLKEDAHVSILIEEIIQSSEIDIAVQGLAAFLFGICYEYNDGSDPTFSREKIQPIILNRIGADLFISRFDRLRDSEYIDKVSPYLQVLTVKDSKELPNLYFDFSFAEFFKSTYDTISRSVIKPKKEDPDTVAFNICKNKVTELEQKVKELEIELAKKEENHNSVVKDNENFQNIINNLNENIQKQKEEIKQKDEKILELENKLEEENKIVEENKVISEKISEFEKQIQEKDNQIKELEQKNLQVQAQVQAQVQTVQKTQKIEVENHTSNLGIIELTNKNNSLTKELEEQKRNYELLEQEQDDLLVCLAEHDLEIKKLKMKLNQYGENYVIEEDEDEDEDDEEEEDDNENENEKNTKTNETITADNKVNDVQQQLPVNNDSFNSIENYTNEKQINYATDTTTTSITTNYYENNQVQTQGISTLPTSTIQSTVEQLTPINNNNETLIANQSQAIPFDVNSDNLNNREGDNNITNQPNSNLLNYTNQSVLQGNESITSPPPMMMSTNANINTNAQNQNLIGNMNEQVTNQNVENIIETKTTTQITTTSTTHIPPPPTSSQINSQYPPPPSVISPQNSNQNISPNPYITSTTPPLTNSTLPPPPTASSTISPPLISSVIPPPQSSATTANNQPMDILSQNNFVNSPSSSRRHNRHLYNTYVPKVSFLPQTQQFFQNNK